MLRLAHRVVPSLLYGFHIETGVDSEGELCEVGIVGDHWCMFSNRNEYPRKVKVAGSVKKKDGLRFRRLTNDGQAQELLKWSEPVELPARPGANWLTKPDPESIELHQQLAVIHVTACSASLEVKFRGRRAEPGAKWEEAGSTVLFLRLGNRLRTNG